MPAICTKLMVLTNSDQHSLCFSSIWASKSDAALFDSSPKGALRKAWKPTFMTNICKSQIRVSNSIPMARKKARSILRIVQKYKVVLSCLISQAFSIQTGRIISPVRMPAVKVTRIETDMLKHCNGCWC